jgi:hypothetical protein
VTGAARDLRQACYPPAVRLASSLALFLALTAIDVPADADETPSLPAARNPYLAGPGIVTLNPYRVVRAPDEVQVANPYRSSSPPTIAASNPYRR